MQNREDCVLICHAHIYACAFSSSEYPTGMLLWRVSFLSVSIVVLGYKSARTGISIASASMQGFLMVESADLLG